MATKCVEYDVAGLYLKGAEWDVELGVERFRADEEWERRNPMGANVKGKGKGKGEVAMRENRWGGNGAGTGGLVGQLR